MILLAATAPPFLNPEWFYLFVANPVLGLVEGGLVAWLLRRPRWRLICSLILANYLSAILARSVLLPLARLWMQPAMPWVAPLWGFWLLSVPVVGLFVLTVLVEWPFAMWGIRSDRPGRLRTLLASTAAQIVTFPAIVLLLISGSSTSFVTTTNRDPGLAALLAETTIYYVADGGATVRVMDAASGDDGLFESIAPNDPEPGNNRLLLCAADESDSYDLRLDLGPEAPLSATDLGRLDSGFSRVGPTGRDHCLKSIQIIPPRGRLRVTLADGAMDGLRVSGKDFEGSYAMATPFARWYPEHVTLLPGNLLIFGMAEHIWLLHPESGRIAVLAKGRSPVVRWR